MACLAQFRAPCTSLGAPGACRKFVDPHYRIQVEHCNQSFEVACAHGSEEAVGFAQGAEHAISHSPQVSPLLFKALRKPIALRHTSHITSCGAWILRLQNPPLLIPPVTFSPRGSVIVVTNEIEFL
jgi:hypothetical protein